MHKSRKRSGRKDFSKQALIERVKKKNNISLSHFFCSSPFIFFYPSQNLPQPHLLHLSATAYSTPSMPFIVTYSSSGIVSSNVHNTSDFITNSHPLLDSSVSHPFSQLYPTFYTLIMITGLSKISESPWMVGFQGKKSKVFWLDKCHLKRFYDKIN